MESSKYGIESEDILIDEKVISLIFKKYKN